MVKKILFITTLFFLAAFALTSCIHSKSISIKSDNKLMAWNEDTLNMWEILLLNNKKKNFYYTVIRKDSLTEKAKYYSGTYTCSRELNSDTFFLKYDKKIQPPGVTNFVYKDAMHAYLIQDFINGGKRMFLRYGGYIVR